MTDVTVPDALPTRKLTHTTPSGKTFSYTVTTLTEGCYLLEADHTHEVRQFATPTALHRWFSDLKAHLDAKYPAPTHQRTGNDISRHQHDMMRSTGAATPSQAWNILWAQYAGGK